MHGMVLTTVSNVAKYPKTNVNYHLQYIRIDVAVIDCRWKNISNLGSSSFSRFRKLEMIKLHKNDIRFIEYSTFEFISAEPNTIWKIDLSTNKISSIASNAFRHLSQLKVLTLYQNEIGNLVNNQFDGLVNLNFLDIALNRIKTLNTSLSPLINLKILAFSENKVKSLDKKTFYGLEHLTHIEAGDNLIQSIENTTFDSLIALEELTISDNRLDQRSMAVVEYLSDNLCGFDADGLPSFSNCDLEHYEDGLEYYDASSFIDELSVRRKGDLKFPRENVRFYLQYRSNESSSIMLVERGIEDLDSRSFSRFTKLQKINLKKNGIKSIARLAFEFPHGNDLKRLNLRSNNIDQIDTEAFNDLIKLKRLNLADNRVSYLSKNTFEDLYSLEVLNLKRNRIETIADRAFMHCGKLLVLNVSKNKIRSLGGETFVGLAGLNELALNRNPISQFEDGTLSPFKKLKKFLMKSNKLDLKTRKKLIGIVNELNVTESYLR
ncbi:Uncharacterised protein g1676 [Pycnogonum litorale]